MSQIAEAAEVSESTFFRYFATKEAVALWDDMDPLFLAAFQAQPADMGLFTALRAAAHSAFGRLTSDERAALRQRTGLIVSVPELRGAVLEQFGGTMGLLTATAAERTGRSPDDLALRVAVGAALGAWLAAVFVAMDDSEADLLDLMDKAIGQLEAGLKL